MPTSHNDFDVARKLFQNSVFVIPTFQRPYAWEKNQMDDLIHDIHYASTLKKPVHYLSPIHAIKIENPQQPEWIKYSEPKNPHIAALAKSNFTDSSGGIIDVHLVVD